MPDLLRRPKARARSLPLLEMAVYHFIYANMSIVSLHCFRCFAIAAP